MAIDNLSQGGKEIPLPEDVQARIENARNNITILDAEATRLKKLIVIETEQINALHAEKVSCETSIKKLNSQIEDCIGTLASKKTELSVAEESVKVAESKLEGVRSESSTITAQLTKRSAELDSREKAIKFQEEDVNDRNLVLLSKETDHEAKVAKLKAAIE